MQYELTNEDKDFLAFALASDILGECIYKLNLDVDEKMSLCQSIIIDFQFSEYNNNDLELVDGLKMYCDKYVKYIDGKLWTPIK